MHIVCNDHGVTVDGEPLDPTRSQKVWNHSPDGFAWGYGGSGPAQLALALLLHAGLSDEEATRFHQDFKWATVANWGPWPGPISIELDIHDWIRRKRLEVVTSGH